MIIFIVNSLPKGLKKRKEEVHVSDNEPSDEEKEEEKKFQVSYKSSRSGKSEGPSDMGATATVEIGELCFLCCSSSHVYRTIFVR